MSKHWSEQPEAAAGYWHFRLTLFLFRYLPSSWLRLAGCAVGSVSQDSAYQDSSPQEVIVEANVAAEVFVRAATETTLHYFRRYSPAVSQATTNQAVVTTQYGKHPVTVNITADGRYRISITSDVTPAEIAKWLNNLKKDTHDQLRAF